MMSSIPAQGQSLPPSQSGYSTYAASRSCQTAASLSKSTDLVIYTQEGDKVTLSTKSYDAYGYGTYENLAVGKQGAYYQYGQSVYAESSRALSYSVSGDLNDEELQDINRIVGAIGDIMGDLVAGDMEGALSKSMNLGDFDSISRFSADLSVTASWAQMESSAVTSSLPSDASATDATALTGKAADALAGSLKQSVPSLQALVSQLDDFFARWLDSSSESASASKGTDNGYGRNHARHFADRLMQGLKQTAASTP